MDELQLYTSIRSEIVANHVLMHAITVVVVILLLGGIWIVERQKSILSAFLPLLSVAWASAILRFDFFIHRQAAYLRALEAALKSRGIDVPYWESWKANLHSTKYVVPLADMLGMLVIVIPTVYLLLGPAKTVFDERKWRGHLLYSWAVIIVLLLILCILPFVPRIAAL